MVTDVMDSVNFAHWDTESSTSTKTSQESLCHAQAALIESIIFHEEGLSLTAPQFIDGVFAAIGNYNFRKILFELMRKGIVDIGIYHELAAPEKYHANNIWEYLSNLVFSGDFIYSSMPNLTYAISSGNDIVKRKYHEVQKYLLHIADDTPAARPKVNDGSPVGEELAYFMDFIEEFASVEREIHSDIYRIEKVKKPVYRDFIQQSLCNDADSAVLLGIFSDSESAALIDELRSCQRRSDSVSLLNSPRFSELSCIEEIRAVMNTLYNKHAMLAFDDAEIHIPRLATADRRDILRDVLARQNHSESIPAFRFSNTETLLLDMISEKGVMTIQHALSLREEIRALCCERNLTWDDSIKEIKARSMLSAYGIQISDNGEYAISLESDNGGSFQFLSNPDYDAAMKLDILSYAEAHVRDSFTV